MANPLSPHGPTARMLRTPGCTWQSSVAANAVVEGVLLNNDDPASDESSDPPYRHHRGGDHRGRSPFYANDKGRRGRVVPAIRSCSPDLRMPSPAALIGTRCYRSRRELVCRSVTRRVRSPRTPRERIHNLGSARSRAGGVFKGPLGQPAPGRTERSGPSDRPPESRQGSRAVQRALGECLVGLRGHPSSGSSRKVSTPWSWQLNS